MLLRRITQHVSNQNWFAIFIDFIIVVVGVFIGIQVANWNQELNDKNEQYIILELLEQDIQTDIDNIEVVTEHLGYIVDDYFYCLDVLARKIDAPKSEFDKKLSALLNIPNFTQKRSSFENILSSGTLDLIQNQQLANEITNYYNSQYERLNSAMKDYTREIIAPFIMNFDYIPTLNNATGELKAFYERINPGIDLTRSYINIDRTEYDIKPKSLDDYRNSIFIINMLTQKIYNHQGQIEIYKGLKLQMLKLQGDIKLEQNKLK